MCRSLAYGVDNRRGIVRNHRFCKHCNADSLRVRSRHVAGRDHIGGGDLIDLGFTPNNAGECIEKETVGKRGADGIMCHRTRDAGNIVRNKNVQRIECHRIGISEGRGRRKHRESEGRGSGEGSARAGSDSYGNCGITRYRRGS